MDRTRLLGYVFGVLTAASWGTSPIFIRKGLEGLPSSLWGVTVGLFSATVVYAIWLLFRWKSRQNIGSSTLIEGEPVGRKWDRTLKLAIFIQALAGIAAGIGTVGRTLSIELAPVVVAIPLSQTSSLFTLIFAPLILGTKTEGVNLKLSSGVVLVLIGSVLVVIGRNL